MTKIILWKTSQLLERGWTEEKIDFFLRKNYGNKAAWNSVLIEKTERKNNFINFSNIENRVELSEKQKNLENQSLMTLKAIERINVSKPFFHIENSLLNKGEEYLNNNSDISEIIHFPNGKDFLKNGKFYAYSDGCKVKIGGREVVTCAGWIENENGEIIVELTKKIENQNDNESFEMTGIQRIINIAIDLGLKNVSLHTDSKGDSEGISFSSINTFEKKQRHFDILKTIENFEDFSICYIPREYNQHSDALTKIFLKPYENIKKQDILNSSNELDWSNPIVNREKKIYFENNKIQSLNPEDLLKSSAFCLYSFSQTTKTKNTYFYNFLINTKTQEFSLISKVPRESLYDDLLTQLSPEDIKSKIKNNESDYIHNMNILLEQFTDFKEISVNFPSGGVKAITEKIKTIPSNLQEEIFMFHKILNKYDKVSFGFIPSELATKIKIFVGEENYKIFNLKNTI